MPFEILAQSVRKSSSDPNKVQAKSRRSPHGNSRFITFLIGKNVAERLGLRKDDQVEVQVGNGPDVGKYLLRFSGGDDALKKPRPLKVRSDKSVSLSAGPIGFEIDEAVSFTVRATRAEGKPSGPVLFIELPPRT